MGDVEPDLVALNGQFGLSFIGELIERKADEERGVFSEEEAKEFTVELDALFKRIDRAEEASKLPEDVPETRPKLDELLRRARLSTT